MDKRLTERIFALANQNVTKIVEIKRCLDQFVEETLFSHADSRKPLKTNSRYYPSRKDIRNQVAKAIANMKYLVG